MGKVIQFPTGEAKRHRQTKSPGAVDTEALRLMQVSDELDAVILKYIEAGTVDPRDLAGLMAHRLGTLMRHLDQKSKLWDVCERVLKSQAALD